MAIYTSLLNMIEYQLVLIDFVSENFLLCHNLQSTLKTCEMIFIFCLVNILMSINHSKDVLRIEKRVSISVFKFSLITFSLE